MGEARLVVRVAASCRVRTSAAWAAVNSPMEWPRRQSGVKPQCWRSRLGNMSTHSTEEIERWLAKNPNVTFHFTPTWSAWMNQIKRGSVSSPSRQSVAERSDHSNSSSKAEFLAETSQDIMMRP
jgi:hypothetical protein